MITYGDVTISGYTGLHKAFVANAVHPKTTSFPFTVPSLLYWKLPQSDKDLFLYKICFGM